MEQVLDQLQFLVYSPDPIVQNHPAHWHTFDPVQYNTYSQIMQVDLYSQTAITSIAVHFRTNPTSSTHKLNPVYTTILTM